MRHFILLIIAATFISACNRDISPDSYSAARAGEDSDTYEGVIVSERHVKVKQNEKLQDNSTGMLVGGGAGALAGSTIGRGTGSLATALGGALIGATAGAFAEDALGEQDAIEYIVKITNGKKNGDLMTVTQGPTPELAKKQKVYVIVSRYTSHDTNNHGRSRIIARD